MRVNVMLVHVCMCKACMIVKISYKLTRMTGGILECISACWIVAISILHLFTTRNLALSSGGNVGPTCMIVEGSSCFHYLSSTIHAAGNGTFRPYIATAIDIRDYIT